MPKPESPDQTFRRALATKALNDASAVTGIDRELLAGLSFDVRIHGRESARWKALRKILTRSFPKLVGNSEYVLTLQDHLKVLDSVQELSEKVERVIQDNGVFLGRVDRGFLHVEQPLLVQQIKDFDQDVLKDYAGPNTSRFLRLISNMTQRSAQLASQANKQPRLHPLAFSKRQREANDAQKLLWYRSALDQDPIFAGIKSSIAGLTSDSVWRVNYLVLDAHRPDITKGVHLIGRIKVLNQLMKESVENWRPYLESPEGRDVLKKLGLDNGQRPEVKLATLIDLAKGPDFVPSQSF